MCRVVSCRKFATHVVALAAVVVLITGTEAAEPLPVAVVNLDRLLKEHQPLAAQLAPIKEQLKELEDKVRLRQAEAESVVAKLRGATPGTVVIASSPS